MTNSIDLSDIDINISGSDGVDTITLDTSSSYPHYNTLGMGGMTVGGITSTGSITVPHTISTSGTSSGYMYTTGTGTSWAAPNTAANHGSLKVSGDADFDGDVTIKGRNITKMLEKIEDRLAILMDPDPTRLEKFQALKKAYDNYKLMDKLCQEIPEEDK
jgi:hypothetical protein